MGESPARERPEGATAPGTQGGAQRRPSSFRRGSDPSEVPGTSGVGGVMSRRVRCRECRAPVWTDNRVWCKCDVCGAKIWMDRSPEYAPPDLPTHVLRSGGA